MMKTGFDMRAVHFLFAVVVAVMMSACNAAPNQDVRCSNVYITAENLQQLDYDQYVPQAQAFDYFHTIMVGSATGGEQYLFEINLNNYINRTAESIEPMLTDFDGYFSACNAQYSSGDTVHIAVQMEEDIYSVFRVRSLEQRAITAEAITRLDNEMRTPLYYRAGESGSDTTAEDGTTIFISEIDTIDCNVFTHVRRVTGQDTVGEIWLDDILFSKDDALRQIALRRVDQMAIPGYLQSRCE